jgi:predicted RNA-binding Zn-ribbon protein involved in translation (DUF1610 family)
MQHNNDAIFRPTKKLTKKQKMELINNNICWKCKSKNTITKTKSLIKCTNCGLEIIIY